MPQCLRRRALKDAEEARRHASERSWSPVVRVSIVIGIAVSLVTLVGALVALR